MKKSRIIEREIELKDACKIMEKNFLDWELRKFQIQKSEYLLDL